MFGLRSLVLRTAISMPDLLNQQTRNTFILRRVKQVPLHKKGGKPTKMRARHFIYDLVQDTNIVKQPDMPIILTQFVDGVGNEGDVINTRPNKAYRDFLLPGLAVYATPENMQKFKKDDTKLKTKAEYSSPYVQRTISCLSRLVLNITMNKIETWTLEPWHVRASFRKTGFVVPEYAIEMPPIKISGPDLSLQNKEFYVTVTINNSEKVNVRCRIHHWATGLDRLPWEEYHWLKPCEPLIPEQAAVLESMPLREPPKS